MLWSSSIIITALIWSSQRLAARCSAFVVLPCHDCKNSFKASAKTAWVPSSSSTSECKGVGSTLCGNNRPRRNGVFPSALHLNLPVAWDVLQPITKPLFRKVVFLLSVLVLAFINRRTLLWPGSAPDPSLPDNPLPVGLSMGCPFFGRDYFAGSETKGPMYLVHETFQKLGKPPVFKFYSFLMPFVALKGKDNIKKVLEKEFTTEGANTLLLGAGFQLTFGDKSILYESDKSTHSLLRRLIGTTMTPPELARAVPSIQKAANQQIDKVLQDVSAAGTNERVVMDKVCTDFTVDVAWRHILGLDLRNQKEIDDFHKYTKQWLSSFTDPLMMLPIYPGYRFSNPFRARNYLLDKVEEKLSALDELGHSDGSSLGAIYFARDEEGGGARLSRQQVIDNGLILIVAGSDTSASALAMAVTLLGHHKDVWEKVKDEQISLISKYGPDLTKEILDDQMPYLEAVIKETMRIAPLPSMEVRKMGETVVIDGKQIPKNYMVLNSIRQTHEEDPATYTDDGSHMDFFKGFKPERWLPNNEALRVPEEYIPWGYGARRCVGERLAMVEMKIFLATLARRIDFDLVRGGEQVVKLQKNALMTKPQDGSEIIPRSVPLVPAIEKSN